ncbi:hypothetical protein OsJ_22954 [Oryza sativa Japonica Group]|uniref:SCP domain-containing protein n=1 Tax=Oryza sativa subsp. japonica TaxID=39947 RepID=B9FVB3_ORYSJ|nr:hypothetical protein OsJ_22954 [Oryza sativa Japonica Group]
MAQKAFALVLLAAATLAMAASTAAAQSSPQDFLDAHNAARRGEGAGLPDVAWSTTLQAFAESYVAQLAAATTCSLAHSNSKDLGLRQKPVRPGCRGQKPGNCGGPGNIRDTPRYHAQYMASAEDGIPVDNTDEHQRGDEKYLVTTPCPLCQLHA